jgi:hypothetical protein
MPPRAKVKTLPAEVKSWLDQALIESNFSDYQALEKALEEKGFSIGKSSLQRYGAEFEDRLAAVRMATEQARALAETVGDDENALGEGLIRLVQERTFQVLVKMNTDKAATTASLSSLGEMVAKLSKSSVELKRYRTEVKEKVQAASENVKQAATKAGASPEFLKMLEEEFLGILR